MTQNQSHEQPDASADDTLLIDRVTGRMAKEASDFLLTPPNDVARRVVHESRLRPLAEELASQFEHGDIDWQSSDACLLALEPPEHRDTPYTRRLVSWSGHDAAELEHIVPPLRQARSHAEHTGVLGVDIEANGRLRVDMDYRPRPRLAPMFGNAQKIRQGIKCLSRELDDKLGNGLVHGGINERWLNLTHDSERRIMGYGLAEVYATWRQRHLECPDATADPRFGSVPHLVEGSTGGPDEDRWAMGAVIASGIRVTRPQQHQDKPPPKPWRARVTGLNTWLNRKHSPQDWWPEGIFHDGRTSRTIVDWLKSRD